MSAPAVAVVAVHETGSAAPGDSGLEVAVVGVVDGVVDEGVRVSRFGAEDWADPLLAMERSLVGRRVVYLDADRSRALLFRGPVERGAFTALAAAADLVLFAHLVHPEWDGHEPEQLFARYGIDADDDAAGRARAGARTLVRLQEDLAAEGGEAIARLVEGLEAAERAELDLVRGLTASAPSGEERAIDPLFGPACEDESDEVQAVEDGALLRFFGPGGPLASRIPGYVVREAQVGMARAVAGALAHGRVQVVEAGTGVGKSFAYLVPALLHAVRNQRPVVVATRTKNLQAQLYDRDLPRIAEALDLPLRAALVKGRADYLCRRRLAQAVDAAARSGDQDSRTVVAYLERFARRSEDGDLERLSGWIRARFRGASAWIDAVRCEHGASGRRCPFGRRCFYPRIASRARTAHLLVANHALALKWPRAFPKPDALVFDEAHDLVDTATEAFGVRVTDRTLGQCVEGIRGRRGGDGLRAQLRRVERRGGTVLERVHEAVEEVLREAGRLDGRIDALAEAAERLSLRGGPSSDRALVFDERVRESSAFLELSDQATRFARDARKLAGALERLSGDVEPTLESAQEAVSEFELELLTAKERLEEEATGLDLVFGDDERSVTWLERSPEPSRVRFELRAAPIDVGRVIARFVLDPTRVVVLTSATLRVGGSFDFFARNLGVDRLEPGREEMPLFLGSPYDYREALRFFVPLGGPHPLVEDVEAAARAIARAVLVVSRALGGRTLVLFNAKVRMLRVTELLRAPLAADGIRVLCPGPDGGMARVLDRFRREPRAVLLGARAFWEGVDAPGGRVRCAILERIPFESPGEPVHAARARRANEAGESGFLAYSLPRAIVRLLQGSGRVIRGEEDRGAVLVLDHRVATHPRYGRIVRDSLPAGCEIGPEAVVYEALLARLSVAGDGGPGTVAATLARATEEIGRLP